MKLPATECKYGYTEKQISEIIGLERLVEFNDFMRGQTVCLCEGRAYSHELKKYIPTNCGPHGTVVYPWDVAQFLAGRPPLD